ncbi:cytochrome b/b6 domain-containing protein [Aestuariivita boseongensis]|uniref:cytochrome b/b6 domain-containing protein n=1 Tax=Aestuariivita boseongensis TaxID=1470562 RepID=UPI0006808816|nr:cytochrome b/b6 domain-containing protein [Aestuariivita boseongensis]
MTAVAQRTSGRISAREVAVWDPLVRLIHWTLALTILLNATVIEDESTAHEWIGYVALGLVGLRVIWALVGPTHARFSSFPPSPARAARHLRAIFAKEHSVFLSHNPLGALMVYNIWLSVIALGVTGYMMTTLAFFGVEWVEEAHEVIFGWLVLSVALHVAGVALETRRSGVKLVRAMITGRKNIPEGSCMK